jgi:hypothetical protein
LATISEATVAKTLEFPDHAWKEKSVAYGVEVAIDLLPSEFAGKWRRTVERSIDRWVRSKAFKKPATLWMWGTMSANFLHETNLPCWSEFVVPVGLPKAFLPYLHDDLSKPFRKGVRFSEAVQLVRDDGWAAICHVQDGIVWVEEDADLWVPYGDKEIRVP